MGKTNLSRLGLSTWNFEQASSNTNISIRIKSWPLGNLTGNGRSINRKISKSGIELHQELEFEISNGGLAPWKFQQVFLLIIEEISISCHLKANSSVEKT